MPKSVHTSETATDRAESSDIRQRIDRLDWRALTESLETSGFVTTGPLLTESERTGLLTLYSQEESFRKKIVMEQHGYGSGEYKYFAYPLPPLVAGLRTALYEKLVPVANSWAAALKLETRYPEQHEQMLARCHAAGQQRPTPLLLQYRAGDFNCLHQDLYGEHAFPLQVVFLLSQTDVDFEGGEFILLEQRPRMQSRAEVVPLRQGEGVIFAVQHRPVQGTRGSYRVNMRHGVSRVRSGSRSTLGIIFHDSA